MAGYFPSSSEARSFLGLVLVGRVKRERALILERVGKIDKRELEKTEQQIVRLVKEWGRWAEQFEDLIYFSPHAAKHVLLKNSGDGHTTGWDTLQSMRNVDRACAIRIV